MVLVVMMTTCLVLLKKYGTQHVGTNINLQKGVGSSTNVNWTSPSILGGTKLIVSLLSSK